MTTEQAFAIAEIIRETRTNPFVKTSAIAVKALDILIESIGDHCGDCVEDFDYELWPCACGV